MQVQQSLLPDPIYRYVFDSTVHMTEIRDSLRLAILAVESMHGRFRVLRDLAVECDFTRREVIVDGSTEVGRNLSDIFAGYVSREFGDDAFTVAREVLHTSPEQPSGLEGR